MKRPNKIIYFLLNCLARIYTIFTKNHHFHNPNKIKVKSPSIVISNHTSFFDFLYVMWAFKTTPVNFVVARKYYETKPLSTILKLGHTIPKSLFQHDTLAIKKMLQVIKNKGVIGMFPEGQISVTGVTLPFPKGIGKLIKKCKVNVYGVKTTGAYLTNPPWTNIKRKGRIDSELLLILTPEEIGKYTDEKIEEILYQALYTNPYLDENADKFIGKNLAKGLDNLLYLCPKCHSEGYLESKGNQIKCKKCNHLFTITPSGNIIKENGETLNIDEAYLSQRQYEKKIILQNLNQEFIFDVDVESIKDNHYQIVSRGQLIVNKDLIRYVSNDSYEFTLDIAQVRYVPFDNGKNFQIYYNNQLYQFIPKNPYLCSKAVNIIELFHQINTTNN